MITNIVLGVMGLFFSIAAYTQLAGLPAQSAMFPRITIVGMGIASLLLIVDTLWKHSKGKFKSESGLTKEIILFQIAIPGAMLFATYFLLRLFGFYISSYLLVLAVYFYQTNRANGVKLCQMQMLKGLGVALVITGAMYIIFTMLLSLPVPRGSIIG